jgi:nitrogen-specific signal transduction histidine kinase/CheY-like chemotaxis protein
VYVRADGSTFPVEITASPMVEDDVVRGAVVVFRDVTQRREVDRMKNEFLSVVSHELRTPLTSILGSLELLASGVLGELSPRARDMTTTALESSKRLTRLINDILDLDRIQSGNRPMHVVPVTAEELLTRSVTEMAGLASSTGVHIDVGATAGRVSVDGDMIVQTLTNLLGNAVKFSSPGQTVVADAVQRNGQVLFRVHDQGRGIPPEKLETIFQRFEQVDSSDSRQMGGTGLGLAICRGIVERHGGRIWAESTPEDGTTVQFTLPAAAGSRVAELARPASREHLAGASGADARGTGGVLVVEDDRDLAVVLETLLAAKGLPVTSTGGVADALRAAADAPPRVVVLDILLPDGDGYAVIDALRSDPRAVDTDVVVYSAVAVTGEDRARLTLGRTVFITKGRVEPAAVAERVAELMASPHHHQGGTR